MDATTLRAAIAIRAEARAHGAAARTSAHVALLLGRAENDARTARALDDANDALRSMGEVVHAAEQGTIESSWAGREVESETRAVFARAIAHEAHLAAHIGRKIGLEHTQAVSGVVRAAAERLVGLALVLASAAGSLDASSEAGDDPSAEAVTAIAAAEAKVLALRVS